MILGRMKFLVLAAALSAFSAHGAAAAPVMGTEIIQKAEATLASSAGEARQDCQRHWRHHPHWRHRYWHRNRWYRHRRFRRGRWVYW
jgi:hypothetical protein